MTNYKPGDVIVKTQKDGKQRRWVVLDPPLTTRGKLRLVAESGAIITAWWADGWLPPGYRQEADDGSG